MGKLRKIVHSTFAKLSMTLCVAVLLLGTVGTNILNITDYSSQTVEAADGDLNNQFTTANGWVRTYPPTITAQESASTPTTAARIRIDVPAIVSVATTQKSSYPSDSSSNTHASYKPSIVGDTPVAKDSILESAWTTTKDSAIAFEYNNQTDLAPQQAITFSFAEQVYQGTEALVSGRVDIPNNTTQKVTSEVVQAITGGPNVTVTVPDLPN